VKYAVGEQRNSLSQTLCSDFRLIGKNLIQSSRRLGEFSAPYFLSLALLFLLRALLPRALLMLRAEKETKTYFISFTAASRILIKHAAFAATLQENIL
jgi:hypothetical protein